MTEISPIEKAAILKDLYRIAENLCLTDLDKENFSDGTYSYLHLYNQKQLEYLNSGGKRSSDSVTEVKKEIEHLLSLLK